MISKNKVKYIQSLNTKKFRQKYKKFVVEGDKIAYELLSHLPHNIDSIFATESWIEHNKANLKDQINKTITVSPSELKKISNQKTPNQVLMVVSIEEAAPFDLAKLKGMLLYLDGIQDPGNMGAIIRTASWFDVELVCCSEDCVDIYNPKVIQSSMGAFIHVPVMVSSLNELREQLPQIPFYGTVLEGENLYKSKVKMPCVLTIGNEGKGINPENLALFDKLLSIPRAEHSRAESLNAGIATGIICAYFSQIQ